MLRKQKLISDSLQDVPLFFPFLLFTQSAGFFRFWLAKQPILYIRVLSRYPRTFFSFSFAILLARLFGDDVEFGLASAVFRLRNL